MAKLQKELKEERIKDKKESDISREPKRRFNKDPVRKGLEGKGFSSSFYEGRKGTCRFFNEGDCRRQQKIATEDHTDAQQQPTEGSSEKTIQGWTMRDEGGEGNSRERGEE